MKGSPCHSERSRGISCPGSGVPPLGSRGVTLVGGQSQVCALRLGVGREISRLRFAPLGMTRGRGALVLSRPRGPGRVALVLSRPRGPGLVALVLSRPRGPGLVALVLSRPRVRGAGGALVLSRPRVRGWVGLSRWGVGRVPGRFLERLRLGRLLPELLRLHPGASPRSWRVRRLLWSRVR